MGKYQFIHHSKERRLYAIIRNVLHGTGVPVLDMMGAAPSNVTSAGLIVDSSFKDSAALSALDSA